ncbi:tape measure protein [Clostridium sp. C2-6-12]|uniref:tape measure protein n=1 Tax=Clostridium sp. C2-6-12 TaxID=2698832 RepID=UPI001367C7A1|nr:tape measure protein [Clostridium sp. C2-6-12]
MAKTLQTNIAIGGILNPSLQKAFAGLAQYASKTSNSIARINSRSIALAQNAGSQVQGVSGKIKAALVTGTVATAGTMVGKSMLSQAASLEQYRNTLNVVMKDNTKAAETFAWANDYANKTPFETGEIVDATVKLTSYGLEAKKVLPLTGDMAAAMGKSIDQATEAIADAQTGELERMKEFGITKNMIVAQGAKTLAGIEIVNNKGQITNQKAFNAALFSLMKERYAGSMEIQSKSFNGLMSTITGVAKNGLAQIAGIDQKGNIIAGSAFDIAKQKVSGLADKLTQMQSDGTFDAWAQKFTGIAQNVSNGVDYIIPKIGEVYNYVSNNGPQIIQIAEYVGKAFLGWKAISAVSSGVQAIKGVYDSVVILKSGLSVLSYAKMKDRAETIYLNGLYAKDAILRKGSAVATGVQSGAHRILNALKVTERIESLKSAAIYAKDAVVRGVCTVATGAQTAAQWALNAAMSANPIALVIIGIAALVAAFIWLWNNSEGFRNFFIGMWQSIQVGIQAFDSWLTSAMQTDWSASFGALGQILNTFFYIVGGIWDAIKMVFSGVIDFVSGVFAGDWSLAWNGIVQIFSGIMNGIGSVMKAPLNAVIGLINAAIGGINSTIQVDIPEWVPAVGGQHFGVNIPTLPMFANGGFTDVPSIFGDAGPEAAIPLKRNNPRSISLLEKTASAIGYSGNQGNGGGHKFVFAPQISGNVDTETFEKLKQSFEDFREMVLNSLEEEKRECYGS